MPEKKIIAVVGATGAQGGGLAHAILADPDGPFRLRALTRDPQSASAQKLAALGAEVVKADLDDAPSLRAAFEGAHGAFVVTNYWAPRTEEEEVARSRAEMEIEQAGAAAAAAKEAGVAHVIWSTFEDTRDFFGTDDSIAPSVEGGYKVPHFDAKAEANLHFTKLSVPTTFLVTTFYFDSMKLGMFTSREDGKLRVTLPIGDSRSSGVASEDIGRTALGVFKRGSEFIGKTVGVAGSHLTGEEWASALGTALGEEVEYRPASWEEYRAYPFPGAVEISNMFQFYAQDSERFTAARNLDLVRELNPELKSFAAWLEVNKNEIPVG
ncbi:MAG TPA: NmrA/HSCARG family protein [Glaciibacter sp.]|nr:NmrA/HSCARG family protein [Glaciibacter sp.]